MNTSGILIKFNGKEFKSIAEFSRSTNIPEQTLRFRMKNWPKNKWLQPIKEKNKYVIENNTFTSVDTMAKFYKIGSKRKLKKLLKEGLSAKEAVQKVLQEKQDKIIYKNKSYNLLSLSKKLKLPRSTLRTRIFILNWPEEDWHKKAIDDKADYKIIHLGKEYQSTKYLAAYLGVNHNTLQKRIQRGEPESEWGRVGEAKVSMGYTWPDIPIRTKELVNRLALSLKIDPVEAYQLMIEKMFKK